MSKPLAIAAIMVLVFVVVVAAIEIRKHRRLSREEQERIAWKKWSEYQ